MFKYYIFKTRAYRALNSTLCLAEMTDYIANNTIFNKE